MEDRRSHAVLQIKLNNAATSIMKYTRWKSDCSNSCLIPTKKLIKDFENQTFLHLRFNHGPQLLSQSIQAYICQEQLVKQTLVPNTESLHQYDKNCKLFILLNSKGNKLINQKNVKHFGLSVEQELQSPKVVQSGQNNVSLKNVQVFPSG